MTDPIYEARLAGGVYLWDATYLTADAWPPRPEPVRRVYLHHSGADGALGVAGLYRSDRYSERGRGWPSTAYHYWIPAGDPAAGRTIRVYHATSDDRRSWHTGGACNDHGVSVCLQGDLRDGLPTSYQLEALEALIPWIVHVRHAHTIDRTRPLSWHSESARWGGTGKPTCPGPHVERWARKWRGELKGGG